MVTLRLRTIIPLLFLIIFTLFIRLYKLDVVPASLFGDEIDASYHAWSLGTTLRDYSGQLLPTYIHSLSEWRAPLLMYVLAPFVSFLGPSAWSARLPMAILGTASVFLVFLIFRKLYPKKFSAALLAALFVSISPLHFHYSRNAVEQPPLFFLLTLGIYLYLRFRHKLSHLVLSLIVFTLTFYTYSVANILTPSIILLLLIFFPIPKKEFLNWKNYLYMIIPLLLMLPISFHLFFGQAAGRFKLISVFSDTKSSDQVVIDRIKPWVAGQPLEFVYNNRPLVVLSKFSSNYLNALSWQNLFLTGDSNYRQQVDRFGSFLILTLPLFLFGLIKVITGSKEEKFLCFVLLVSPIASALTVDGSNHASRLFFLIFPVASITALGADSLLKVSHLRYLTFFFLSLVLMNFSSYLYRYFYHYRYESTHVWQYGYEELFAKAKPFFENANRVFINNTHEPTLYRFGFYAAIQPSEFQQSFSSDVPQDQIVPNFNGFVFGTKYYFGTAGNIDNVISMLREGDVYLAAQGKEVPGDWDLEKDPPKELKVLATVRNYLNQPLFYVLALR